MAVYPPSEIGRSSVPGRYHEVRRGQTLWGISRMYNMELTAIVRANRLPDASKIEVGQLIFIPEGGEIKKSGEPNAAKVSESFAWPVKGAVSSYFGSTKDMAKNKGIDIEAPVGTCVKASRSGKVTFVSDHMKGYGKTVIIDHLDGFETVYAHNTENLVTAGQNVTQGQTVARVGDTGRAEAPSLHFEIRKGHKPQNPFYYLP